jgi:release factor glutamine methyltransferase
MGDKPLPFRGGVGGGAVTSSAPLELPHPDPSPEGEGLRSALNRASKLLTHVSDTPRLDAELLLAHALGVSREALLLGPDRAIPDSFDALLARRLAHEPVAYITGRKAFWTLELAVTPDVLIPRPESETLIEAAIAHFCDRAPVRVLDLGTGSGALLLAALDHWPGAQGIGVDRSAAALAVARGNAERLSLGERAAFVHANWAEAIDGQLDLILCNPPYIEDGAELPPQVARHEPASALFAGPDGLDDYRIIVPQLRRLLAPGGLACLEIGHTQAAAVQALAATSGMTSIVHQDLGGRDRCVAIVVD